MEGKKLLKSNRVSVLVLAAFLFAIVSGFGLPQAKAATVPTDIASNWAVAQITSLVNQGVVSGYPDHTFKPDNIVTRAEFISMINKTFGYTNTAKVNYYDVRTSDWYYNDIAKATAAGYIAGYPDGSMNPNDCITREEASVIVARVLAKNNSGSGYLPFNDDLTIQVWARNSVAALVQAGLISGYPDGTFRPAYPICRAEAAAMIYNSSANRAVTT